MNRRSSSLLREAETLSHYFPYLKENLTNIDFLEFQAATLEEDGAIENNELNDLLTYCDLICASDGSAVSIETKVAEEKNNLSNLDEYKKIRKNIFNKISKETKELPWVFLDIDSTLVLPGKSISLENKQAIQRYINEGGKVSLVTGKIPVSAIPLIKELEIDHLPHIGGNGAIIFSKKESKTISQLGSLSSELGEILFNLEIPYCIYHSNEIFYSSDLVLQENIDYLRSVNEPTPNYVKDIDYKQAIKLLMFINEEDQKTQDIVLKAFEPFQSRISIIRTSPKLLEIMDANQSKGNAIKTLTESHQHYCRYSVAAGDSQNDLSMLNVVGMPFIVSNASSFMKEYGFTTLPSCADNGVAALINNLLDGNIL